MPVKVLKAIFGWLDFFTKRYAGESLKSGGNNPTKTKEKTPEELFIENNLINVEKELKNSRAIGDKFPGIAPGNWELIRQSAGGGIDIVKKGVIDYDVCANGDIIYSNGKYLKRLKEDGTEQMLCQTSLANNISVR